MTSYYEQLKDPRWQKMRLEVLSAANWMCVECDDKEKTLNVHHTYYVRGRAPWEYEPESLRCLCEDCHEKVTLLTREISRSIGLLDLGELEEVAGFIRGRVAQSMHTPPADFVKAESIEMCFGISAAFGIVGLQLEQQTAEVAQMTDGQIPLEYLRQVSTAVRGMVRAMIENKVSPEEIERLRGG